MQPYFLKNEFIKHTQKTRLHNCPIPIIGLTGGIATGKSTVAQALAHRGILVIDADKLVKEVYQKEQIKADIKKIHKTFISDNEIDFKKLRQWAFQSDDNRLKLESLIYPHLPNQFHKALNSSPDSKMVIYDVPLLFEKSLDSLVGLTVCIYIPQDLQIERLVKRDALTRKQAFKILESQWDIELKIKKANCVIDNSKDQVYLTDQLDLFITKYLGKK